VNNKELSVELLTEGKVTGIDRFGRLLWRKVLGVVVGVSSI
jgi:hypothetical protein